MATSRSAADIEVKLLKLGELEESLAQFASLAANNPVFPRELVERVERQFAALSRQMHRSAARARASRDVELSNAYERHAATTVSEAARELRAEARLTPTTTVSAGLRRVAASEIPEPLPLGGRVAEGVCADCGECFAQVGMGSRRCAVCAERREKRRRDALERALTRLVPTRLSDGWAQVADEEAKTMRRILRRGDR